MITITNNNIYYSEFDLSNLSSLDGVDIIYNDEICNFLSEPVSLGESVTFKRLFDIVSDNIDNFNNIYFSTLGGHKLDPFLQEIENNQTELTNINYIEIYWNCDKFDNELSISPSLQGVSDTGLYYSLDFVGLNNIKTCIVDLNENIDILDYNKIENKNKKYNINLGEKTFTLFELFNAIFFQISIHGGPLDKSEIQQELEKSISSMDEEITDKYELQLIFDDIIQQIDDNDDCLVIFNGFRDRIDESRITIPSNLTKLKKCMLEKLKVFDKISKSNRSLKNKYKQLTDIEFNMQMLYGEPEDIKYHKFWETPKCTCPKIDNLELFPSDNPIFDKECPIHGTI